jgi:arabinofuranosyltransferase
MEIAARRCLTALTLLCLAFCLVVLARGWVAEDAYITFRVIDNALNSYGLRWNIHERVQVYTHPLWMLLELTFTTVWNNPFLVSIFFGTVCTAIALGLSLAAAKRPLMVSVCCFFLPLLLSKSILDYATSGLETSLNYALFAAFGYVVTRLRHHPRFWLYCSACVALALCNRLDMLPLYAPPFAYLAWKERKSLPWRQIVLGFTPLAAWLAFALLYYGFLFPNSKYAKLDTGLPFFSYLKQGLYYVAFQLKWDLPGTLALLFPALMIVKPKWFSGERDGLIPIAAGIYAYCFYIVCVGGDYMAGRFFAVPIFASVWLLHYYWPENYPPRALILLAAILVTALFLPPIITLPKNRVIDARFAFKENQLVAHSPLRLRTEGEYVFAEKGKLLAMQPLPRAKTAYSVGMLGYYAGPKTRIVDELALTNPLLARLPAVKSRFYIGHFRRKLPRGYLAYMATDSDYAMPKSLAEYTAKLHVITAGDLFAFERLKTIVLFNLGYYDHWREEYLENP